MALLIEPHRVDVVTAETLLRLRARQERAATTERLSLREFISAAWHVIEPATVFRPNWHIDVVADHLEAVTRGEIRNLIINIPPRHGKSSLVAVFWPTWEWTFQPHIRWLFTSYAESLSVRDALKSRRVIQSAWYQQRWGHVFHLTSDQNLKGRYENTATGYRLSTSVGGSATGEGGDRVVTDDPHKIDEAESEVERESVIHWWDETMSTRLNDPQHGAKIIVMQRLHEQDLTGHVLESDQGYHHLCLPAEYDPQITVDMGACSAGIPHEPERRNEGELLWSEQFSASALAVLKVALGPYATAGQLQQRPSPRAGMILDPAWFRQTPSDLRWDELDLIQFWDTALSEKQTADYTAGVTLAVERSDWPRLYVIDVFRKRISEERLDEAIAEHILLHKPAAVGIERRAFEQQGATQDLVRRIHMQLNGKLAAWIEPVPADTDKVIRARVIEGRARAGMIFADLKAPWWSDLSIEMSRFPVGGHDDQVDALAGAVRLAIEKLTALRAQRVLLGHHSRVQYETPRAIEKQWPASWDVLLDGVR